MGMSQDAYIYYGFNIGDLDGGDEADWWEEFSWGDNKGLPEGTSTGYAGHLEYAINYVYVKDLAVHTYWGTELIPEDFINNAFAVSLEQQALIHAARAECIKRNGSDEDIGEVGWFLAANYG
jgi:hypothetical protein